MLRKVVTLLANEFKHPLLMGLYFIAMLFLGLGVVAELTARPTTAGLLGVYSVLAVTIGTIGYAVFYAGQIILYIERQYMQTGTGR